MLVAAAMMAMVLQGAQAAAVPYNQLGVYDLDCRLHKPKANNKIKNNEKKEEGRKNE